MMLLRKRYNNLFGHTAGMKIGGKLSHRPPKAVIRTMFALFMLLIFQPGIHAQSSISIRASATVIEVIDIQLVPLNDMVIDESYALNGIIDISPITGEQAGKILVKGKINSLIRLSYLAQQPIVNTTGDGMILCKYTVSGYQSDNQHASQILDSPAHVPQFNEKGEYYLWVGGRIDLNNARPGNYSGEFIFEIEYI